VQGLALLLLGLEARVDPVTLIIAALATGAVSGIKETASAAVMDAYEALKGLARKRLASRPDGELVLTRYAEAPEAWERPLAAELGAAGADRDSDLVAAAQALMSLVDAAGSRTGKYRVDVRHSQGVQIGDHNTQHNTFG
jgi:hypothetical protein